MESPISFPTGNGTLPPVAPQVPPLHGNEAFLRSVLGSMVNKFLEKNPTARSVLQTIQSNEPDPISFDHIAIRTLRVGGNGIESLQNFFLDHGYKIGEELNFPTKKVRAHWLAPPAYSPAPYNYSAGVIGLSGPLPRIFVSELIVDQLDPETQGMIKKHVTASGNGDKYGALSVAIASSTWSKPSFEEYKQLVTKNEYGAWTVTHGRAVNHVAVAAHRLKSDLSNINNLNRFLTENGFKMNDEGGVVKESSDGMLLQSTTVAENIPVQFTGGVTESIPFGFVEFVERLVLPQYKHLPAQEVKEFHRREGFEVGNAFKLMDSTFKEKDAREGA